LSRILELQTTDEQTIVARVLLELHQAIDVNFPNAGGTSRQFSKTVLSTHADSTAIDNQPGAAVANAAIPLNAPVQAKDIEPRNPSSAPISKRSKSEHNQSGHEFSKAGSAVDSLGATIFQEVWWSRWLTKVLLLGLFVACIAIGWIYYFGFEL
jgi:hypothetical protein